MNLASQSPHIIAIMMGLSLLFDLLIGTWLLLGAQASSGPYNELSALSFTATVETRKIVGWQISQ